MEQSILFDIVIYHSPCPDGTCSAWIVKNYYMNMNKEIEFIPCQAGKEPTNELEYFTNKKIIFVDICPPYEYILKLSQVAEFIQIIDHHKTNYEKFLNEEIPDNIYLNFDMNFSGCQLTWKYFNQSQTPWFVQYIGDRDLWKFSLPNTNEYFSGMFEENLMNLDGFQKMYENINNNEFIENILTKGKLAIEFRDKTINNVIKFNKIHCTYKHYNIWLYSTTKDLMSDVGNKLMKYKFKDDTLPDFTVGWIYDVINDEFWISMRSLNEKEDVSEICKEFGGGGHRNASGCTIKSNLNKIFIPKLE
jgi:oligoribonuclease NrnB/cAMP/cGMP phosphodiesterase (DHH superfamily)